MEIVVEVISRSKKVLRREKVKGQSITIGRAYDNDIILTEPHVSEHHAKLEQAEDGRWFIHDLNSTNGILDELRNKLVGDEVVHSGDIFSIGKVSIRVLQPDHPVESTLKLSGLENVLYPLTNPMYAVMTALLFIGTFFVVSYQEIPAEIKYNNLIRSVVGAFIVASLWPLFCSLLARLFKHEVRLSSQLAVCYSFFIVFLAGDFLLDILRFNTSASGALGLFTYFWYAAVFFTMLWLNFYLAIHQSHTKRSFIVGGLTCILISLFWLAKSPRTDFNPRPQYDSTMLPPSWQVASPVSTEEYLEQASSMFDTLNKKVKAEAEK